MRISEPQYQKTVLPGYVCPYILAKIRADTKNINYLVTSLRAQKGNMS
jgi:hypothetical protein